MATEIPDKVHYRMKRPWGLEAILQSLGRGQWVTGRDGVKYYKIGFELAKDFVPDVMLYLKSLEDLAGICISSISRCHSCNGTGECSSDDEDGNPAMVECKDCGFVRKLLANVVGKI